jgi:hypothetical protein
MSDPLVVGANVLLAGLAVLIVGHCYRGYDRNESRPLAFLGLGIALITFPSFVVYLLVRVYGAPAYVDLLVLAQVSGLISMLYAFRGA